MDALEQYIHDNTSPEEDLLRELDRETHLRMVQPRMISGHIQGQLLHLLTRLLRPHRALEIGTFTGYSALCIAAGLEETAHLDTIEVDDEQQDFIQGFFDRSVQGAKITLHIGSALDVAPALHQIYDLVFIDGDKREYPDYYHMIMGDQGGAPLVKSGSVLLADNILWYGKVVEPILANDHHTQGIINFNRLVHEDPRVENVILPIRDGLNLIRVK
ncbi:MAG: class I SAM-dependent methyltransferase [Alistipes sp.]